MIEQIPSAASDPTLSYSILPRAAERCLNRTQADVGDSSANCLTELAVSIVNQELMTVIKRKGFAQLLRDPLPGRVAGDVASDTLVPTT